MILCQRAIRCYKNYPRLEAEEVVDYSFVRETENDIYIQSDLTPDDFIRKIMPSNTPSADIFEFSVFLYGYYNEKHMGIRNAYFRFPLFLQAKKLYQVPVCFEGECFTLSFSHCPTGKNYWHFQLYTVDGAGNKIPRKTKKGRDRNLAKYIIRNQITKAICQKSEIIPFQRPDFDKKIRPFHYLLKLCFSKINKLSF